ncbi:Rhodanese-like protein [Hanseniaspora valbyensis NRRL Y-1626]|uniref:Rhodanese-like protein n=1 Tax=Hanseniaspora valbyensis NRRL Y-1626 TaxID=766949 RepID=A0A1B7TGZ7_9ASCO|nr:Rhodanese-like protein [Hanseniaspora valbyensis NRRL Y-1626]
MSLYKIISPKDYINLLKTSSTRVITVDASWHMPNTGRVGIKEYFEGPRLPNSIFFDIDDVKDDKSEFPHMLPTLSIFNEKLSNLGILPNDTLVVYDKLGNFSSPRAAWTLTTMGHLGDVYLLNNFKTYLELSKADKDTFKLDLNKIDKITFLPKSDYKIEKTHLKEQVLSFEDVKNLVDSGKINDYNFFDARALPRFLGTVPEPREGLQSGHIPGVQPLPFSTLLDSETKEFPSKEELKKNLLTSFKENGVIFDIKKPTLTMCGTGVTGCIIKTALEQSGLVKSSKLYDGSWTEWATIMDKEPKYITKKKEE